MTGTMAWVVAPVQGIVLPESTLRSDWFAVLAAFVAINTVMYVALALAKTLPKLYPRDWLPRTYVRSQTRSIYPDAPEAGPEGRGVPEGQDRRRDGRPGGAGRPVGPSQSSSRRWSGA